jgi:hypothetical protein
MKTYKVMESVNKRKKKIGETVPMPDGSNPVDTAK